MAGADVGRECERESGANIGNRENGRPPYKNNDNNNKRIKNERKKKIKNKMPLQNGGEQRGIVATMKKKSNQ